MSASAARPVVLVVPDGASDPLRDRPSCLEEARTPCLDRLASEGVLLRVRTIPEGLPPGTEVGLPSLLGMRLDEAPSRGRIDAAGADVLVSEDEGAWRLDVHPPTQIDDAVLQRLDEAIREVGGRVHRLHGHRLLLTGPAWWGDAPPGPHQTEQRLREFAVGPFGGVAKAAKAALYPLRAWPWGTFGTLVWPQAPALLGRPVVVVARDSAAGVARLLGCELVAALPERLDVRSLYVVHVPDADDAGHARDRRAKVRALERLDEEVIAPLAARDVTLVVCPDHGCDPVTGRHNADPVPAVVHAPGVRGDGAPRTFDERYVQSVPVTPAHTLLPALLRGEEAVA